MTKTKYTFMGIDPGMRGSTVVLDERGNVVGSIRHDNSTDLDVAKFIQEHSTSELQMCVLERVASMPGQGVSTTFKFGVSYGMSQGVLLACAAPFDFCTPRSWQKALGIKKKDKNETDTQWKNRLKQNAQRLFPNEKIVLANADAFLIAEYCRREYSTKFGQ